MLWMLAGCPAPAPVPVEPTDRPDGHGTVLHASPGTLVVQHDDLRGRVVPGVERYTWSGTPAVTPGDAIDVWHGGDASLERLVVTGRATLPDGFVPGGVPLVGTVVNVDGIRVTVDHEPIPEVMPAMVMGFGLAPWEAGSLSQGDRIAARLIASGYGWQLVDPVVTGTNDAPLRTDIAPLTPGDLLPATTMVAEDGSPLLVGEGQARPSVLTFVYTRCPDPSFCPAIVARMAALQEQLPDRARIVTVTLDPEHDTPAVLTTYARITGADPERWRMGRAEPLVLQDLALRSGQHVTVDGGRISHLHRVLVLDGEGRLIERYDTADWPMDRVVEQLTRAR
jgi:protein SCO1/2